MEVVGLVASVMTLIGAASLTSSTIHRAWGLRGSPPYLITALNEVNDFKALLEFIRAALTDTDDVEEHVKSEIKRLLDRANEKLHAFDEYLKTKVLRDGEKFDSNARLRKSAKLREVIGEGQVQVNALQQELNSVKMNLMLAINISQLQRISKVPMSIQKITLVEDALDMSAMSETEPEYSPTEYLENVTSSLMSPYSTAITRYNSENQLTSRPSYVSIETNVLSRCIKQCPCQCHIPMQGSTPQWLKGIIGTAFFKFVGTPLLNHRSCNFVKCENRSHGTGSARLRYFFPTWLLPTGIEFAASWGALGGIGGTWSLKLPRAVVGDNTYTLFHWLTEECSVQEFRRAMVDRGVRAIDVFPESKRTSLLAMALYCEREDICLMLLEAGADAGAEDMNGMTSAQLFWQLYLLRSDFQHFRQHPVVAHARNDCILGPVHQLCIDYAEKDELDRQIALDPGCVNSRDCYGFTPLHWAVRSGNVDAVDSLLQAGANVNAVCNAGRPVLSWSESWTICKMLLDSGADIRIIENNGNDAIFCAINSESSIAVIELLLEASSKFDERLDIDGSTYLMVAMLTGLMDICELILEYTTNISAQDKFGFSALTYAIRHNFHAGMELLLDHGADTTQLDCDGDSIIVLVALFGDIETMRILEYEQIKGLPMEPLDVDFYWAQFRGLRHRYFLGWTAPVEEEEEAFQAFLDSITPCDPKGPPNRKPLHVPGAFSVSDDDSEDDVELGNSDTETVDYESCDEEFVLHGSDGYDAKPQYEIVIRPQSRGKDVRGGTVDAIV